MYVHPNVPHAIASRPATVIPPRVTRDSVSKRAATWHAVSRTFREINEKGTYHMLQQPHQEAKGDVLPQSQDETSCDVFQPRDVEVVEVVESDEEVVYELPEPRTRTRQSQQ
jgi:hypothetical protein